MNLEPPYRFDGVTHAGDVVRQFGEALDPGGESGATVTVAGRLMLLRTQGKLAFGTLRDWTGSVQLFALESVTEDFTGYCGLNSATGSAPQARS